MAHAMSLPYPKNNSLRMLNGARFAFNANQRYSMPTDEWEQVKDSPDAMQDIIRWYVQDFYQNQLPRITTLQRYYQGDNDIKFWQSEKSPSRADNRVASGLPRYITNIRLGYQFGNPLKFGYSNPDDDADDGENLLDEINKFNSETDEEYHEKIMGKNLNNTGRAYELLYIKEGTHDASLKAIDPANCFVVYDTTIEQHSLFAVRFYMNKFMDQINYYVDVYTDTNIFHFKSSDSPFGEYTLLGQDEHYFQSVPVTEYQLNDERLGAWEPKLDEIDAYDKSLSEMANSQEDFSNSILVISGDIDLGDEEPEPLLDMNGTPVKDEHGNAISVIHKVDPSDRMMFLKPNVINNSAGGVTVIPTDARYLTKELNATDWKTYVDRLLADVHKDTNTPDVTDENFAANASGVAMTYKLWGNDQERAIQESLYIRGLMRRLRLLTTYWQISGSTPIGKDIDVENVKITFTPNLPKNNAETVANMQALTATGSFSAETMREMGEDVTGIPATQEAQRYKDEQQEAMQSGLSMLDNNGLMTDQERSKGGDDNADQPTDTAEDNSTDQAGRPVR